ncbi:hypothetical protein B5E87_09615 [Massilimicrobiota sp. An142]|uniref:hypothetical protein n=1 Tax=Massilimicrobiota sp. An142 TaxID=1965564 RepID=UPI000B384CEC|nr:hypothetical protein [Massilimicrobiota sp. An142]OUQ12522.1 hypothetical protein B5E87_09615 [Massilimicrobiota sp. An142]
MDEIREWNNPNEIVINYGVYFYQNDGQRQEFYIFDMKSFQNQIPKTFHTLLMPLSHHSEDYENRIMDDDSEIGVYLRESEMIDDGDYDWEENYYSDYKEFYRWHRIQYDPVSGKRFVCHHVFSMDVSELFERLNEEYEKILPYNRKTKKQQREMERLSQNINTLTQDWYTDENGIRNPVELLMNQCLLTEDERKLLEV